MALLEPLPISLSRQVAPSGKAALGGRGEVIESDITSPEWARNPDIEPFAYDPEKAKEILAEAAADGAWDPDRELTIIVVAGIESRLKIAEIMQQQLDAIGVKSVIKLMTGASWMQVMESGEYDFHPTSGPAALDPSDVERYYLCAEAWTHGYCNPELDALFELGRTTGVVDERQQAYWEAAMILREEVPRIPVATAAWIYGLNKGIGGIIPSAADYSRITWNIEEWYIEE